MAILTLIFLRNFRTAFHNGCTYQNSNSIGHRNRKKTPKIHIKKKILTSQNNPEEKEQNWRHHST